MAGEVYCTSITSSVAVQRLADALLHANVISGAEAIDIVGTVAALGAGRAPLRKKLWQTLHVSPP
jgi:hypothetical protein